MIGAKTFEEVKGEITSDLFNTYLGTPVQYQSRVEYELSRLAVDEFARIGMNDGDYLDDYIEVLHGVSDRIAARNVVAILFEIAGPGGSVTITQPRI